MSSIALVSFYKRFDDDTLPEGHNSSQIEASYIESSGNWLLCRHCAHSITHTSEALNIDGAHSHAFTNPHGITFTIRCFSAAPGVIMTGDTCSDDSWFSGYSWQILICGNCIRHMGWKFQRIDHHFFTIIADNIFEENIT